MIGTKRVREEGEERVYFALIGDVVGSRDITARADLQHRLREILAELNRDHEDGALAAPLKITAGDEVQGLLADPEAAVDIVVRVADRLHPVSMRWGLGRGSLTTDAGPDVATLDGECFHRARGALEGTAEAGGWLGTRGWPPPHGAVLAALFRLMNGIRSRWSDAQIRYVRGVRDHLQREVAGAAGVDESTVSRVLQNARFASVKEGEAAARELLRWLGSAGDDPRATPPEADSGEDAP